MKQVFKAHRLCEQEGPLGPYIDSYAADMRGEGYAQQTSEVQIRLIADFGRWLAKRINFHCGSAHLGEPGSRPISWLPLLVYIRGGRPFRTSKNATK